LINIPSSWCSWLFVYLQLI